MNSVNDSNGIDKAFTLASQYFQAGLLDEAKEIYHQILHDYADHPRALHALGVIAHCSGNGETAVELILQAIAVKPDFPDAFNNLGNILKELGRLDEAVAGYQKAIALIPDFAMAHNNLGNALRDQGKIDEAIACFQSALAIDPNYPDAFNDLGNALTEQGKLDEAITCFRKTLALSPDSAGAHNNLGNALMDQGKLDKAISCFHVAITLEPTYANAYNNLGVALARQGTLDEAASSYRKSLEIKPDQALTCNNLGSAYRDMGRLDEAITNYGKAINIRADYHEAYNNLAVTLAEQGRLAEAFEQYRKALAIKPDYAPAHSNLIFAMNYSPAVSAEEIFEESCRWYKMHALPRAARNITHHNDPSVGRRLRIGYVSPDFRKHSVSYFFEPLIANHDRDKVEVHCYSDVIKPDTTTRHLKRLADSWLNCIGLTDEALAERIRHDRIDILVDLAGHTALNRLAVFAEKPAPIQVAWLGYPNTTGLSTMDYRLTDATVDPEGTADSLHTEKLYRLPEAFLCYRPPVRYPRVSPLPAYTNGFITFGSFNNLTKMTPEVVALWGELLKLVPESRLILKNKALADASTRRRYLQMFNNNGIGSERLEFFSFAPSTKDHLSLYNRIDIALDTFPYNGTTTTCEALWKGVPVITFLGNRHAARVGASISRCVGLDELIAKTPDDYLGIAVRLANDLERLATLRRTLRKQVATSPLCNAKEFAINIETAFRQIWLRWCNSHPSPSLPSSDKGAAEEINRDALSATFERASQLFRDRKLHEAQKIYTQILKSNPGHPRALHALGVIAYCSGKGHKAVVLIRKALEVQPDYADAYNNLGNIYKDLGYIADAISCYEAAVAITPDLAMAHCNLGNMHRIHGSLENALLCFNRALAIDPQYADGYIGIASVYVYQGKIDEAVANYRKVLALRPDHATAHSNLLFMQNYLPSSHPSHIFEESLRWDSIHAQPHAARQRVHANKRSRDRRLRIGYVSSDFRQHSVSYFSAPLIAAHDRSKVEIFCYADVTNPDKTTKRFQRLADTWRPTAWTKNEDLAEQIRNDGIDILVDLAGHTAGGTRLPVFAEKPAPVQVTWLGYPNTTGVSAIDYRLTDSMADPEGSADRLHSEKLIRLPSCFLCYAPPARAPKVVRPPASDNGFITFGSFNCLSKIRPEVLELWCRLLVLLPNARLILKSPAFADPATCRYYLDMIACRNVNPDRIVLLPSTPSTREHLALYGEIDISLDTFPYNGTTTTCESLWMGVPVITLRGDCHAARVSASILHCVGLDDLVAGTPEEYLDIALSTAMNLRQIGNLRQRLRKCMSVSPLCDAVRFANDIEEAYRRMWISWCDEALTDSHGENRI